MDRWVQLSSGQILRPIEMSKPGGLTDVFPFDVYVDTPEKLPTLEYCVMRVEIQRIAELTK